MGFMGLFGDNSGAQGKYGDQMRDLAGTYNPYIERGNQAGDVLWGQNQRLVNDPNSVQNQVAAGYSSSPYQQMLLADNTRQMNANAANTGMIGSPLAQRALNDRNNTMTGQFMNDYVNRGMGSYAMGMQGMGQHQSMGFDALNHQNDYLSQGAGSDLQAAKSKQGGINKLVGTAASLAAAYFTGGASLAVTGIDGSGLGGGGGGGGGGGSRGIGLGSGSDYGLDSNGLNAAGKQGWQGDSPWNRWTNGGNWGWG